MAYKTFGQIEKVNKGTSRDEWGVLKYWTYKTPDGTIRSQLTPDGSGLALLEVRHYDPSKLPSYRKRLDWSEAAKIGSCWIKVEDAEKGLTSSDALEKINDILEAHDLEFNKWTGQILQGQEWNGDWSQIPHKVDNVSVHYTEEGTQTITVGDSNRWSSDTSKTRPFTNDLHDQRFREKIGELRKRLMETESFLDKAEDAFNAGLPMPETKTSKGFVNYLQVGTVEGMVNDKHEREGSTQDDPLTSLASR